MLLTATIKTAGKKIMNVEPERIGKEADLEYV
jgi:hypothetical protein